jgi:predicted component of type VI protein secretion system
MSLFLPCLLQRWGGGVEGLGERVANATWADVRDDVLRNLEWLLNTESSHDMPLSHADASSAFRGPLLSVQESRVQGADDGKSVAFDRRRRMLLPAEVRASTFCFGVPTYSGRPQSTMKPEDMARDIRQRILWFEPRLRPSTLEVKPEVTGLNHHFNTLRFEVTSDLLTNPVREFQVRTEIDMETGEARLLR